MYKIHIWFYLTAFGDIFFSFINFIMKVLTYILKNNKMKEYFHAKHLNVNNFFWQANFSF